MLKIRLFLLFLVLCAGYFLISKDFEESKVRPQSLTDFVSQPSPIPLPTPSMTLIIPPSSKTLQNDYYIRQTFNNCGPAALSMALSYYGISQSQYVLGKSLRPYQHPTGNNDDKSVTLAELAEKSKDYGFIPYHRSNGSIELIKLFITYDIPIITRTALSAGEDIGHFRVVKGFDDQTQTILQDDSLQNKNLRYNYEDFNTIWEGFNNEYLAMVPVEKQQIAEAILKDDVDSKVAWEKVTKKYQEKLAKNPDGVFIRFNLSVAYYNIGDFKNAVSEFEKIEDLLPARTLWYQIEPIKAYFDLGNDQKVIDLTSKILNNNNRAFSELYILRGKVYKRLGDKARAKLEFEKALIYNRNLKAAQDAFNSIN